MTAQRQHLQRAAAALAVGGIVAYPTEAVWGLGCEPLNGHALARLLALKQRPQSKGVILVASSFAQLRPFVAAIAPAKLKQALQTWPGPHTWVLPAARDVPDWLSGGRDTIAVRVTAHPVVAALCSQYGGAIVSSSANISSRPPARTALQVRRRFGAQLDYILSGETQGQARPTPIRDLMSGKVVRS